MCATKLSLPGSGCSPPLLGLFSRYCRVQRPNINAIPTRNRGPSPAAVFATKPSGHEVADEYKLLGREPEQPSLIFPGMRQHGQTLELLGSKFDRLLAGQNGLDNIGCEKRERNKPANVPLVY